MINYLGFSYSSSSNFDLLIVSSKSRNLQPLSYYFVQTIEKEDEEDEEKEEHSQMPDLDYQHIASLYP